MCRIFSLLLLLPWLAGCDAPTETHLPAREMTAAQLLGNPQYPAISYGGYRTRSRNDQPTRQQQREDMRLLHAMGIRVLRTYNVRLAEVRNLLATLRAMREEDPEFEMYLMLGVWIDCRNAWTDAPPDHTAESAENAAEIARAITLARAYPEIVKMIAVGNEAMVKWATSYYVSPGVILKWVRHLQGLKQQGFLAADLWITSSDNFASWGGGGPEYHVPALDQLIAAVDFLSVHTYPMHDTHYNPSFWHSGAVAADATPRAKIAAAMAQSVAYAQAQVAAVRAYVSERGLDKPIHIGETGWASQSDGFYGPAGSRACDEYKQALYYQAMRAWSHRDSLSCFFFEAFDEPWKDAAHPEGSENHFGLFTVDGRAKLALWSLVDRGVFAGLGRGTPVSKTYAGDSTALLRSVQLPPAAPSAPDS